MSGPQTPNGSQHARRAPPGALFRRETERPDRFSDFPPQRPPRLELALILMFAAGFLSGGGLVLFICRLTILNGVSS